MATLPLDGSKMNLIATGKVRPVAVYAEKADGTNARVPGAQEKSDFGVPLWAIDVMLDDDEATRITATTVKVPATDEPVVPKFQPVHFEGLTCRPYKDRSGQIGLSMRAESLVTATPAPARGKSAASAE